MRLADYMAVNGLNDVEVAEMIERHRSCISRLRRGKQMPTLKIGRKIQEVTRGKVTLLDWPEIQREAAE